MGIKSCTVESQFFELPMEMKYWFKKLGISRNPETERRETTFGLSYQEVWGIIHLEFFFLGSNFSSSQTVIIIMYLLEISSLKPSIKVFSLNESGLS